MKKIAIFIYYFIRISFLVQHSTCIEVREKVICPSGDYIKCNSGTTIRVVEAIYGRVIGRNQCSGITPQTNCTADLTCIVSDRSNKRRDSLRLYTSSSGYPEPCPGESKYIIVKYMCGKWNYKLEGENFALKKPAVQSSLPDTYWGGLPSKAVDGNTNMKIIYDKSKLHSASCVYTDKTPSPSWWRVDIGQRIAVSHVKIYNRRAEWGQRICGFEIRIGDTTAKNGTENPRCGQLRHIPYNNYDVVACEPPLVGRYVTIVLAGKSEHLTMCEVEVYGKSVLGQTILTEAKLVGSNLPYEGLVTLNNKTFCDPQWSLYDANTTCIQLGYPKARVDVSDKSFLGKIPSGPPTNFKLEQLDATTLELSWSPPVIEKQNGIITNYTVCFQTKTWTVKCSSNNATLLLETTSKKLENLQMATMYFIRVRAHTKIGPGPYTEKKRIITGTEQLKKARNINTTSNSFGLCLQIPQLGYSYIQIIVIKLGNTNQNPRTSFSYSKNEISTENKTVGNLKLYVTAELSVGQVGKNKNFVIGDRRNYERLSTTQRRRREDNGEIMSFYNRPLEAGLFYSAFQRTFKDKDTYYSTSWTEPIQTASLTVEKELSSSSGTGVYVGVSVGLVFLIIIVVVVVVLILKRRTAQKRKDDQEMENQNPQKFEKGVHNELSLNHENLRKDKQAARTNDITDDEYECVNKPHNTEATNDITNVNDVTRTLPGQMSRHTQEQASESSSGIYQPLQWDNEKHVDDEGHYQGLVGIKKNRVSTLPRNTNHDVLSQATSSTLEEPEAKNGISYDNEVTRTLPGQISRHTQEQASGSSSGIYQPLQWNNEKNVNDEDYQGLVGIKKNRVSTLPRGNNHDVGSQVNSSTLNEPEEEYDYVIAPF